MSSPAVPGVPSIVVADERHSVLSPSDAGRWRRCSGAVKLDLERQLPDSSSYDADLGTAAHSVFEHSIKAHFRSPHEMIGETIVVNQHVFTVDEEMAEAVEVAVDYCRDLYKKLGKPRVMASEQKVKIPLLDYKLPSWLVTPEKYRGEGSGTVDWIAYDPDTLHILDYKNGVGLVEVEDNDQMMLYTIGVVNAIQGGNTNSIFGKFKQVHLHIAQPRGSHPRGPCRSWTVPAKRLFDFAAEVKLAVRTIQEEVWSFRPGSTQCKWCDHKAVCPGLAEEAIKQAGEDFKAYTTGKPAPAISTTHPQSLESNRLATAMSWADLVTDWAKAVHAEVNKRLLNGDPVMEKHYKLVEGKSNRVWDNEEAVKETFRKLGLSEDQYAPRSLVGIGEGEKLLKMKPKERDLIMKNLTKKPQGKPALALASDPRPAFKSANQDFADHITQPQKESES